MMNILKNNHKLIFKRNLMVTNKFLQSNLKRFEFQTHNDEFYYAEKPNEFYQKEKGTAFHGLTFQDQAKLPDLPIPNLNDTVSLYLESIKPFCKTPEQFKEQEAKCQDFLSNLGPKLQERLINYRDNSSNKLLKRNWLSLLWDRNIYLNYNDPVIPYVSYFFSHKPVHKFEDDYLMKSTAIISVVLKFIEHLKNESIPNEIIKNSPFCMNSFHLMFNNSRVPALGFDNKDQLDTNVFYSIYENKFMIIVHDGNFYKLSTHDPKTGQPFASNVIYRQLQSIVNENDRYTLNDSGHIGVLTSLPRDQYKKYYEKLVENPVNRNSLEEIFKSSFVLCLDSDVETVTLEEKAHNCWHGNGTNRFFDKPIQFFVTKNSASGFLGEHSKMDGTPNLFLNNYLCHEIANMNESEFTNQTLRKPEKIASLSKRLKFVLNAELEEGIAHAKKNFDELIKMHDLKVWNYNRYGKNTIKQFKMSPDAYIQQIIQLAVYKYLGKQYPTYEAASTRKFFRGRTETGRSVSCESQKFVENWNNKSLTNKERLDLLRTSAKKHQGLLVAASNGKGLDRHFFGLKNMVDPKVDEVPALFQDELFNYSCTWLISTSQLSSEYFDGYGWSQVNDKGFGLAYMLKNNSLHINIVNKPKQSGLSVSKLHYYLNQAADEMYEALSAEENIPLKSKL